MLNFIKNIFYNSKTKNIQGSDIDDDLDKTNAITILVGANNEPHIHVAVTDLDDEKAIYFARLLFDLNGGKYSSSIVNILTQLSKEDDSIRSFVSKTMSHWSLYIELDKEKHLFNLEDPIIKPTNFFKGLRNDQ
jgi:hypothetical protein